MTQPAQRVAIVALLITVGALSAVIAQESATVTTEVRINARQLADGRIELAVQQRDGDSWGERLLLPGRFLPKSVGHSRWIASAPFRIEINVPAPTRAVEGDTPSEAGEPEATVPSDGSPPSDILSPFSLPLPELATYGEWDHQGTGWYAVRVPMSDGGEHYFACKTGSGVVHGRDRSSAWRTLTGRQVATLLVDARHPKAHLSLASRIESLCSVPTPGPFEMDGDPPHISTFNLSPLHTDTSIETWLTNGQWTLWRVPRQGWEALHAACYHDSGAVYVLNQGERWLESSATHLVSLVVDTRDATIPEIFTKEITDTCGVDATTALAARQNVVGRVPERPSTEPPSDVSPYPVSEGSVTGNFFTGEDGNWTVWGMYRADGADAYAACRTDTGALHARTHGGVWAPSTVEGLRGHFGFAPWYFVDYIMQDIGRSCGVHAPGPGLTGQQQQTMAEPESDPEPEAQVRVVSGAATMSESRHPLIHGYERIVIQWNSARPESWSASIRVLDGRGRLVLAPGVVRVSVGGRTFNFSVPDHSSSRRLGSMINHVWSPGTEATLSGSEAHAFYCAAKGSTLRFSLTMNNPRETRAVTVHVRQIAPRGGTDLCE